jgi:hypothetical protein
MVGGRKQADASASFRFKEPVARQGRNIPTDNSNAQRYRWALDLLLLATTIGSIIMEVLSHVRQRRLGFSLCPDAPVDQPAGSDLVGVQQTVTSLLTQ